MRIRGLVAVLATLAGVALTMGTVGVTGAAAASTPVKVSAARQRLKSDLGVSVYLNPYGSAAQQQADDARIFSYAVGLGANSVAIDFLFGVNGAAPTRVYAVAGKTPSRGYLAAAIASARAHGLRVLVRPLMWEGNLGTTWRGGINPPSPGKWFSSYWAFLRPYLQTAQAAGAQGFDLGVELDSLSADSPQWKSLERDAATAFRGQLPVSVNWTQWAAGPAAQPVPYPAVDAYPKLPVTARSTTAQLTAAWTAWLHQRSRTVLAQTVVQELGLAAVYGADQAPWELYTGQRINVAAQQDWFTAACAAIKAAGMPSVYFYGLVSSDNPSATPPASDTFSYIRRGDPAIRTCFASGWH